MEIVQKTIAQAVEAIARKHALDDAIIHTEMGIRSTYGRLLEEIDCIAAGIIKHGIVKGDKVAVWAPNIPEWIISMLALAGIGAVTVPIDPGAGKEHLRYVLDHAECRGFIMAESPEKSSNGELLQEIRAELPNLTRVFVIGDDAYPDTVSWAEVRAAGQGMNLVALNQAEETISPDDPVAIMYTSGTTGKPKGVVLDHLGLINKSLASTERQGITDTDRLCLFFPLFHMFGNTCIALAGLLRGATLVMPCKSFDPSRILEAIARERCTAIYASPSMVISLLEHPAFEKRDWQSLRKGIIGGAPCPMELMKRLVEDTGVTHITVGYGITETSSWITMTHPEDPIDLRVSTIGKPLACNEVKIVHPATGENLPPKNQGEICTKGFLMKEYYKMPGATNAAVDREGWFHTGDLGEMDENGYVRITGRLKDVIIRDGTEIYPVELEEVIYQLPDVTEVQVFGFPDAKRGQEIAAWIKLKQGSRLSIAEISAHVQKNVDPALAPRFYKIVTDFPTTRSGKVQKFKLAEMAAREYER
ncbi:MAG: AMP-binding protein [Deltaproteobacteria bacterium]|nr:AMP-binding protein [Deltaproteobacteria bacterium]